MAKGKDTILNEMMANAAEIIKGKVEFNNIVLEQFRTKGDDTRVKAIQVLNDEMTSAMETIQRYAGCWA